MIQLSDPVCQTNIIPMPVTSPFQMIAKPAGPDCNLACDYCFYLEKEALFEGWSETGKPGHRMSVQVLESYIRQKLESSTSSTESFLWQGGEPTLLGVDYFQKVVALQKQYGGRKRILNSIQTNGILLDSSWCRFFKENHFLVGISIDGPQKLHDEYRHDKAGNPSFEKVFQAIKYLKEYEIDFNTLTTIHRSNSDQPLEIYHFLKSLGAQLIQFIPIVEWDDTGNGVKEWSVIPEKYGNFLITIFNEWVRQDVGRIFVQNFEVSLEAWLGKPSSLCVFSETCGRDPVIEHNGDLFACDHYVYPEYRFGNILNETLVDFIQSPQQIKFGQDKRKTLPEKCRKCFYRFACHGGCPKDRFPKTAMESPGLNYLCTGYQRYFEHIEPYMRFMADELREHRSPANVMSWEEQFTSGFSQKGT